MSGCVSTKLYPQKQTAGSQTRVYPLLDYSSGSQTLACIKTNWNFWFNRYRKALCKAWEFLMNFAFLTNPYMMLMLLVQGPHLWNPRLEFNLLVLGVNSAEPSSTYFMKVFHPRSPWKWSPRKNTSPNALGNKEGKPKNTGRDFPGGPVAKTSPSQCREAPGSLLGQRPRSQLSQPRVHTPQLRPGAAK